MGIYESGWELHCDTPNCYETRQCGDQDDLEYFALKEKWTKEIAHWYCPECSRERRKEERKQAAAARKP